MGLDVMLIEGPLRLVAESHRDVSENQMNTLYERGAVIVYSGPWRYHAPLVDAGVYEGTGSGHFRAGSYSGYNRWREELAQLVHDVDPEVVWDNPERYAGKPFFELIHFSDCEGTIGPEVAAKLADDFETYREAASAAWSEPAPWQDPGDEGWRISLYERFAEFFRRAADTQGAVEFG